ncbi:MAG: J domain-containing protein [Candidatus Brocadiae bacterium]|nr:J domain-containing protein [Candidatus Brocadiia bacterium]
MGREHGRRQADAITAEAVDAARRELNLGETATRGDIRRHYSELIRKWHPDVCAEDPASCKERTHRLTAAKETLDRLIAGYRYSFRPADVRRDQEGPLQQHRRQFGRDPSWDT